MLDIVGFLNLAHTKFSDGWSITDMDITEREYVIGMEREIKIYNPYNFQPQTKKWSTYVHLEREQRSDGMYKMKTGNKIWLLTRGMIKDKKEFQNQLETFLIDAFSRD